MPTMRLLAAMLVGACSSNVEDQAAQPIHALAMASTVQPGDCIDPRSHGAVPNDQQDDRIAIQESIDEAAGLHLSVCIGPGVYNVSRAPNRIASLLLSGDGMLVSGAGASQTTLSMLGQWPGDWIVVEITGSRHRVTDLGIDGSFRGSTPKEQIHLIQLSGPVESVTLDHLRLTLPRLPDMQGGDCIRLLGDETPGQPARLVDGVYVSDVMMTECDRSGFGFQRGVRNVMIARIDLRKVGDSAIDMEPTGQGEIRYVTVRDSVLHTGHGRVNSSITGNDTWVSDVTMDRVDLDGQLFLYRVANSTFRDLSVTTTDDAPLSATKEGAGIRIEGGRYERLLGTKPGPVISIASHGGDYPTDVWIGSGVHLVQRTDAAVIRSEPTIGLVVDGADLLCAGPTPGLSPAILMAAQSATEQQPAVSPTRTRIANTSITGTCKYGYLTGPSGSLVFGGNVVEVMTAGLRFNVPPTKTPVIDGNSFSFPLGTAPVAVSPPATVYVGANALAVAP